MISQNANRKSQNYSSNLKSNDVKVRAYHLSLDIIKFVNELPNQRAFWSIGDQLLRSVTSIGANMIEAQAASSRRDSYPDLKQKCGQLLIETTEISNMLGSSILTLKGRRKF